MGIEPVEKFGERMEVPAQRSALGVPALGVEDSGQVPGDWPRPCRGSEDSVGECGLPYELT